MTAIAIEHFNPIWIYGLVTVDEYETYQNCCKHTRLFYDISKHLSTVITVGMVVFRKMDSGIVIVRSRLLNPLRVPFELTQTLVARFT